MLYVDTSALAKLVVREAESAALVSWLHATDRRLATSALTRTELVRAVRRHSPDREPAARDVLGRLFELEVDATVLERAADLSPASLGTLDAIHLASAERLGSDLRAVLTYDRRMADVATHLGMPVVAPA